MKKLIAKRPILYGSRMYEAGDTLPANDERMVNAWLAAESAELIAVSYTHLTLPTIA